MAYEVKIIKDSIAGETERRLTTMQVTLPRFVLAEFNTHRMLSRNSASSRAIPVERQLIKVLDDPAVPVYWGKNQAGMQAEGALKQNSEAQAREIWLRQRDFAVLGAVAMQGGLASVKNEALQTRIEEIGNSYNYDFKKLGESVHKQITNRLLEPFMWQTILVTATDWDNFYALRTSKAAQPEIQKAAIMMKQVHENSVPEILTNDKYHMPLIQDAEREWAEDNVSDALKVAVGRCARVSYLTHDGKRDLDADIKLHDSLLAAGHMSPFEHVARPMSWDYVNNNPGKIYSGNFSGWHQYRKDLPYEDDFSKAEQARQDKATINNG